GETRKSGKLESHIGTHFSPGVLLSLPSSLPFAVQFQCLNDRVLYLLWRGSRREIFVNPLFRDFKLLHLVRLFSVMIDRITSSFSFPASANFRILIACAWLGVQSSSSIVSKSTCCCSFGR